jgi:peptidylamidoglycolate lyase
MRWTTLVAVAASTAGAACLPDARSQQVNAYQVDHTWPRLAPGYRLGETAGVAVTSRDEVLIFHRADRTWIPGEGPIERPTILRIGADGAIMDSLGAGLFLNPHAIAVDHEDNIWATDNNLHQVFKLSPTGELLLVVGEAGVRGDDGRHFNGVTDVAVARDGSFYVSDGYGNNRVAKFSPTGEFLFSWGEQGAGPGQFRLPHGITLDAQGRVYVADRSNVRIQVFEADGTYITEWSGEALGRPWGVEVGPDGFLYVADGGDYWSTRHYQSARPDTLPLDRSRIHRLDLNGRILDTFGSYGRFAGQMIWAHDVAVDSRGNVFVGDIRGMRAQKFARR